MSDAPVNCTEAELAEYLKNLKAGLTCEPCTYSPGRAVESSLTNSLATPRSAPWRSMSIASKSLRQGKRMAAFHGFPSLRMSSNLMVGLGAGWLILSPVDSPVRTFQWRVRVSESLEPGQGYGRTWPELSVRFDPATLSLRTLPCSPDADSTASSLILPRWGLMRAGVLSAPPKSERPTSATGSGLWPTPVAHDDGKTPEAHMAMKARMKGGPRHKPTSLTVMVKGIERGIWPTPTVHGNYNRKGASATSGDGLATAVAMWPTPTKSDGSGGPGVSGRAGGLNLRTAVAQWPTPTVNDSKNSTLPPSQIEHNNIPGALLRDGEPPGGQLNPAWVERMMGWPDGWTDLALREPVPVPTGLGEDWEGDVPRTVTGVPHRTSRLKALGNGQVPQAAAAAWLMLTQKKPPHERAAMVVSQQEQSN